MLTNAFKYTPDVLENKQKKFQIAIGIGGSILLILLMPFLFTLLKAVTALILTGVLITVATFVGPVLIKRLSRWKYESLINEAKKNPIWVMHSMQTNMEHELSLAKKAISEQEAFVETFKARARAIIEKTQDTSKKEEWANRIALYDARIQQRHLKYKKALQGKKIYDEKVEVAKLEWEAFLADEKASAAFSDMRGDPMDRIMSDTAFAHVTNSVQSTFASLRLEVIECSIEEIEPNKAPEPIVYL
jgi:PIN domain nuclease of toxin-antitoxin system